MNLCKKCKYFTMNEGYSYQCGCCSNSKFVYADDCPIDGLRYWDYESYSAGFYVGPNFGCIHWEQKEAA